MVGVTLGAGEEDNLRRSLRGGNVGGDSCRQGFTLAQSLVQLNSLKGRACPVLRPALLTTDRILDPQHCTKRHT